MNMLYLSRPGLVSALGSGLVEPRSKLFSGDTTGMALEDGWLPNSAARVGRVTIDLPEIPGEFARHDSRNNQLLLAAIAQIAPDIDSILAKYGRERVGVVLGTSTSGIDCAESAISTHVKTGVLPIEFEYDQMAIGDPAVFLAKYLGIQGPAYTICTACTSGGKALISARNLIRAGICDAVITGGVDTLSRLTVRGFASLESISKELCNPLSKNRCGINIGEGAAIFILSREPGPVTFVGAGESSDAYHISAPDPNGNGAETAMRRALADAGLNAADIGYLNLHATATLKNDEMESLAISRTFPDGVPVSGTKPLAGHTLGAAGAIEAAFCWLSLTDPEGNLPPHVWDGEQDPELPRLNLVQPGQKFGNNRRYAMSNSFAFGGNNLSLIFGAS